MPGRELIKQWLKAGYVEDEMFHETESGTPQGGIISPLLANIALDGLDILLSQYKKTKTYQTTRKKTGKVEKVKIRSEKYGFVRYADDFIVTAQTQGDIEEIIPVITEWLRERGLTLSQEKTHTTHVGKGINFLGFHIRQYKGTTLTIPQKEKVRCLTTGNPGMAQEKYTYHPGKRNRLPKSNNPGLWKLLQNRSS